MTPTKPAVRSSAATSVPSRCGLVRVRVGTTVRVRVGVRVGVRVRVRVRVRVPSRCGLPPSSTCW